MERNKIYLCDAYQKIKELPDASIDLIVTDPPYQIDNLKGGGGMLEEKGIQNIMDDLGDNDLHVGIDESILDEFMRVMKKPNIYIWMNLKQLKQYLDYFVGKHHCSWNLIVWQKSNAMPLCSGKYLNDCEYCAFFHKGSPRLNMTYESAKTVYVRPINIEDKDNYDHPTIKPLEIIKNLVSNSRVEGGVVLDPFIGSGTTAVAAKSLGMDYIGFEINPKYHQIACDRLDGITQNEASVGMVQMTLF